MTYDVETLVLGAGLIGSSLAMHLAKLGMTGVRVIDFDLEGTLSSSELNAGGVRATWFQPINIQLAKNTIEYFATVAQDIGYRDCGYLWLNGDKKQEVAIKAREKQIAMGWPVEVWDIPELRRRVPFLDKTDGIVGCIFAPRDGLVNPNLLKQHYRAKARDLGVVFDDRVWIYAAEVGKSGVKISGKHIEHPITHDSKLGIYGEAGSSRPEFSGTKVVEYRAKRVINCTGAWASELAKILSYPCPSHAVRRQVCIFDCRDVDLTPYGMIVDPSGVYFHPEASNGLAGIASHGEPPGRNYHYDGDSFFMEQIWPSLYERATAFERLKHLTGWAGLYEVSPDESAIIGVVESGEAGKYGNVFEAHSFSGHGVMHSYGAGLALAERIVHGRYETMDLTELAGKRFESGRLVKESLVI